MPQAAANKNEYRRKRRGYRMAEPPEALIRFHSSLLCNMKKIFVIFVKFVVLKTCAS